MTETTRATWADITHDTHALVCRHNMATLEGVWGVPTGGSFVALEVARQTGLRQLEVPEPGCLIVDDLIDSGKTAKEVCGRYAFEVAAFDTLYRKSWSPAEYAPKATLIEGWVRFPWEHDDGDPTDAVVRLLEYIGEDPTRDGLLDTPRRVTAAMAEMTEGYHVDPGKLLDVTFDADCNEMVVVRAIPFASLCEHHLLPFVGTCSVAYIPNGRVVGLSKIARLVDVYARRLQLQERLTGQIAAAMEEHLKPQGVGVVVRAFHSCMALRGIRKDAEMVTSALRGLLLHAPQARSEFLTLAGEHRP